MKKEQTLCSICNSNARLVHKAFPGYQDGTTFKIYSCHNCNTSFPSPTVDASKIYDFIYKNGDKVPGYNRYWKYFRQIKQERKPFNFLADSEEAYWGVREALKQVKKTKAELRVLEIGSGLGYLTYALKSEGYNVKGMDISKEAIDNAIESFGEYFICADLFEYVKHNKASYDIIVLTEVIEHIENPLSFIEAISALLKEGGKAILTTPNKSIAPAHIIWDTEAPPIHHWWFSEDSVTQMAQRVGMELSFVDFRAYYRKRPMGYRIKNRLRQPIITKDWELARPVSFKKKSRLKLWYKSLLASLPFLRTSFIRLKQNTVLCGTRGVILCAVMTR